MCILASRSRQSPPVDAGQSLTHSRIKRRKHLSSPFMTRRRVLATALGAAGVALLAACGAPPAPTAVPAKPAEPAKPADAAKPAADAKPAAPVAAQPAAPAKGVTVRFISAAHGDEKTQRDTLDPIFAAYKAKSGNTVDYEIFNFTKLRDYWRLA